LSAAQLVEGIKDIDTRPHIVIILEPAMERNRPEEYVDNRILDVDSDVETRVERERADRELRSRTH
jgi:hypothetical protein